MVLFSHNRIHSHTDTHVLLSHAQMSANLIRFFFSHFYSSLKWSSDSILCFSLNLLTVDGSTKHTLRPFSHNRIHSHTCSFITGTDVSQINKILFLIIVDSDNTRRVVALPIRTIVSPRPTHPAIPFFFYRVFCCII